MYQKEITPPIKIDDKPDKERRLIRCLVYLSLLFSIISLVISIGNFKNSILFIDDGDLLENNTAHYKQFDKWDACLNGFAFTTGIDGDLKPVYKYPFTDSNTPVQGVRVLCGQKKDSY